jgi:hypothetical protein
MSVGEFLKDCVDKVADGFASLKCVCFPRPFD